MSAARPRELSVAFGYRKQTNISTANILADIWRLNKLGTDLVNPEFVTEDDAAESGKGHEFATATYKSHINVGGRLEKYASSQIVAWAASFGLGKVTKSGTTPNFTYTCNEMDPVADGIELPYFSYLQTMRQGASDIFDHMFVGCVVNSFLVSVNTAPGRQSSRIAIDWIGCGDITDPSSITHPTKTAELELPGASLALTINTVDYVTAKNIVSLEWGWSNNVNADQGFYPGSGTESGYAKRGRLEIGDRTPILRFTARYENGSTELATLQGLTTGTAVITQTYDSNNTYTATFQQVGFRSAILGETDNVVTVAVECSPQYHNSNGVLDVVAKTAFDNICQAPA